MKRLLLATVALAGLLSVSMPSSKSEAHASFSVNLGIPAPVYAYAEPRYVEERPVYVRENHYHDRDRYWDHEYREHRWERERRHHYWQERFRDRW